MGGKNIKLKKVSLKCFDFSFDTYFKALDCTRQQKFAYFFGYRQDVMEIKASNFTVQCLHQTNKIRHRMNFQL